MKWSDRIQLLKKQTPAPAESRAGVVSVQSLSEIPLDATSLQTFKLKVEVLRISERETKNGDLVYFLDVRDPDGLRFPVVVWDWQMTQWREKVAEGKSVVLDLRLPKDGYQAFTLA
jgi:hypothetical protein